MKSKLFFLIFTSLLVSLFCLPNSFAQDYTQWHLPEGAKARLGKGRVDEIAHSPDGTRVAVATYSGIWLYDAQTGEELNLFPPAGVDSSGVFSPDSRMLASRNIDAGGAISLWEVGTGNLIRTMGSGRVVGYSPEGAMLASRGQSNLSLWEVGTGNLIRTIEVERGSDQLIMSAAYSPKGGMLASGHFDGTICLWDVETGSLIRKLTGHTGGVRDIAFSPESETLASVGNYSDPTVRLWEVSTGTLIHTLDEGRSPETAVFGPGGRTLISGGYPNPIHLWEVRTGNLIRKLTGHRDTGHYNRIISLMLSADGQTLTGGDMDGAIHSWDLGTGSLLRTLKVGIDIDGVEFSADGQTLTSVGDNGIHLWNPGAANFLSTITEQEIGCVFHSVFTPDRATIAGYGGGTIRLLDAQTGRLIHYLKPQLYHSVNLAFSPDGQMLAGTGDSRAEPDETIRLWDAETGRLIRTIVVEEIQRRIDSIAFSPDGQTLVSAGTVWGTDNASTNIHFSTSILLWDVETGSLLRTLTEQEGRINSIAFRPDGQTLASGDRNGIHLWDVETGSLLRTLPDTWTGSVVFSPDGQTLASASWNGIHLWDVETGSLLRTFTDRSSGNVDSVVFSPDGQTLASVHAGPGLSTYSGTVLLWDVTHAPSEPEKLAADVNGDRKVNIQDLVAVAAALGQTGANAADVNGDGEVNIQDLVAVAAALGEVAAAPAVIRQQTTAHLTAADVQHWIAEAQHANLTDPNSQAGIRFLQYLLAALIPKETALFANYPNPFNPETWIPYQLAKPADVTLTIYDIQGRVVRDLDLGHQRAGMYQSRTRAAYWDGKNAVGEPVASGVYFYMLTAGDFTATRKMLILK